MAVLPRQTKIVATLGPSSSTNEVLEKMIEAGLNVVRVNFSHGVASDHIERVKQVREIAQRMGRDVAIMADLQGPKIRIGQFAQGATILKVDTTFVLDSACEEGDDSRVGLDYPELVDDVKANDILLLDDGKIVLKVLQIKGTEIITQVQVGGELKNRKGINRQGGGLSAPALTSKDMEDIRTAVGFEADYIAVSFPKSGADMYMASNLVRAAGGHAKMIAKIERHEALENLDELIQASDGLMVARGDLAVEIGDAAVPAAQKRLIRLARENNKLTITATQMMESMIESPVPTRAEVSDVANAVLDGTDAVMLSAETAAGKYPVQSIAAMDRTCHAAEKSSQVTLDTDFLNRKFSRVDQSISMAALFTAHHLGVKAIAALTQSGSTALWMSRLNSGVPIFALTPEEKTRRRLAMYRDVRTVMMQHETVDRETLLRKAEIALLEAGVVDKGDLIVITIGEPIGKAGSTNTMKIVRVGEFTQNI